VEAAKLAPKQSHELALVYEEENQKGTPTALPSPLLERWSCTCLRSIDNSGRLYLQKISRLQPANRCPQGKQPDHTAAQAAKSCMLPTERRRSNSLGSYGFFRDWQRTQTQSSVTAFGLETANGCLYNGSIHKGNLREICERIMRPRIRQIAQIHSAGGLVLHPRCVTHRRSGTSAADVQSAISQKTPDEGS
jgi:hypothetical protein